MMDSRRTALDKLRVIRHAAPKEHRINDVQCKGRRRSEKADVDSVSAVCVVKYTALLNLPVEWGKMVGGYQSQVGLAKKGRDR